MTGVETVAGVGTTAAGPIVPEGTIPGMSGSGTVNALDFGKLVSSGISQVEAKVAEANDLVGRFAIDDSIPVHQVTMALEEARLAVELAVQVRSRLVEGYREIMNMQL